MADGAQKDIGYIEIERERETFSFPRVTRRVGTDAADYLRRRR